MSNIKLDDLDKKINIVLNEFSWKLMTSSNPDNCYYQARKECREKIKELITGEVINRDSKLLFR
jgi:hypothetical protein